MHIGVDVGTSGTKTCAFDRRGSLVAEATREYDFLSTGEGRREIDPRSFSAVVLDALAEVAAQLKAAGAPPPRSVTVSSLGEAVVPVDRGGKPLQPFISGTDRRGEEESHALGALFGREELSGRTGLPVGGLYSAGKILWLKNNRPDVFSAAHKWLNVQDFVIYTLCGRAVMDYSIASRTMLFDIREYRWSREILAAIGIDSSALPEVVPSGTIAGTLLPEAARATGSPPNTPVVAGAHDHIANSLGCGVLETGWACNATGTTEGITAIMNTRMKPADIAGYNIACEPFAVADEFCTVAWHNAAGVLLKWFLREFGREGDSFSALDEKCPPNPTGLLILPHLSGGGTPNFDAASKGVVVGLTLGTTRYDIFKALMEGATYELRTIMDALHKCGLRIDNLVVCGGGANSPVWLQLKSDILGTEVRVPTRRQNGALGCSMLGAVACGDFADIYQAAGAMTGSRPAAWPNPENAKIYAQRMREYHKLYPALAPVSHTLI